MALTVEEIKIKVTSEDGGLKKLNTEISQLEAKIKALQNAPKGNVSNFKWFKDMEVTLQNAKVAQQQLSQVQSSYSQSLQGVTSNIGAYATQLATVIALQKAWEISLQSAKFEVLKSNFKGGEDALDSFRKSTAGTVSDANLIKLSNQATDLGVGLKEQAILFALAEDASDKYGTSIEEGFAKVVMASEGNVKGLKSLGIQKEVYEKIVKDLAKVHGDEIDKLDAETQKQIRLEAIIKASNITYDDAINKVRDSADEQERMIAIVGNLTEEYGGMVIKGLIPLYNAFLMLPGAIDGVVSNFEFARVKASELAGYIYDLTNGLYGLQQVAGDSSKEFKDAGEDFVKPFNESDALNSGVTRQGKGFTPKKKGTTRTGSKSVKEQTEELKNLGKEAFSVSGALLTIAQIDLSNFQPLVLADEITVLRQRVVEESQIMQEALAGFAESSVIAMGSFFGALVPPQDALTPFQQLLKTILLNAISTAEGLLFAGGAATFFKAILTGGISLGPDIAFKIAGFAALEAAKGFIGAFANGTDPISRSGVALVGERGPELIYMNKGMGVKNAVDTRAYMSNSRGGGGSDTAIYFSADLAAFTKQTKRSQRDIKQQTKWKRF